jgi:ParB-like chromosome segregation protein Spo0J
MKKRWLTRHTDGQHFLTYDFKRPGPKKFKDGAKLVTPKVKTLKIADLRFREEHPVDLEPRVRYFMKLIKANFPIPPISVQRQKDGSWLVYDGHARAEAWRRIGSTEIQATVAHPKKLKLKRIVER